MIRIQVYLLGEQVCDLYILSLHGEMIGIVGRVILYLDD